MYVNLVGAEGSVPHVTPLSLRICLACQIVREAAGQHLVLQWLPTMRKRNVVITGWLNKSYVPRRGMFVSGESVFSDVGKCDPNKAGARSAFVLYYSRTCWDITSSLLRFLWSIGMGFAVPHRAFDK